MVKADIIKTIQTKVYYYTPKIDYKFPYRRWYIGITEDVDRRKSEHKSPSLFFCWETNCEQDAKDIESMFIKAPYFMKGNIGGCVHPKYVYIYRNFTERASKIKHPIHSQKK